MSEPNLTAEELAMARVMRLSPGEYANFKSRTPKLPELEDAEKARIKTAVAEALAERDAAA